MKTTLHSSFVIRHSSLPTFSTALLAAGLLGAALAPGARAQTPSADNFNPGASGPPVSLVASLAVQADGKILAGGSFTNLAGQPRNNLGRLDSDGTLDMGFNPVVAPTDGLVVALALQADGKILVGGSFTNLCGQARNCIGRLNPNGSLDTGFDPGVQGTVGTVVYSLAVQADGEILVGGMFDTLGGQPRSNIGRLNPDGSLDTGFDPGVQGTVGTVVYSLAVQADGKILVGGDFRNLCGQPRNSLGRLNPEGTLDTGFNPGADGPVVALLVQPDGKILVGGGFYMLGGQTRWMSGRLNANGSLDTGFNPPFGYDGWFGEVGFLALQADGKVLMLGGFVSFLGEHIGLGRFNANGSVDAGFTAGADIGNWDCSLALQTDGKLLVGGDFNMLAGQPRACIGRLNATGPATQSLTSDGSTVTWLRGGTSPEVWRTTFEHSPDGLTWTALGAGTRIPGGWQLTGLSLPPGGVIRARGFVAGCGSAGWFVESVIGVPAIHVNLVRDGSEVVLNWTGGQGPYQVQQSTNLNDPGSWEDVGEPVPTNSMRLPLSPGNLFLRVRGQ